MTRKQAIERMLKATGLLPGASHENYENFAKCLEALGLIEFDEPRALPQKLSDFVMDTRIVQGGAIERLDGLHAVLRDLGLKIIET